MNNNKDKIINRKRFYTVLKWVVFSILCVILIIQILLAVILSVSDESVSNFPLLVFEVTSDSMYPEIKAGDGVLDVKTDYDDLEIGDVITFYQAGDLVTHKITFIDNYGTVCASGIYPYEFENTVSRNNYVGRVVMRLPGMSRFLSMTYGVWRKIIWILVIIFVIFAPELIFNLTEKKNKQN